MPPPLPPQKKPCQKISPYKSTSEFLQYFIILIIIYIYYFFYIGNHTIAIVKGKEEYNTLQESLSNVIRDVNHVIDKGYIMVDGRQIDLEFYLGGDYKVKYHR